MSTVPIIRCSRSFRGVTRRAQVGMIATLMSTVAENNNGGPTSIDSTGGMSKPVEDPKRRLKRLREPRTPELNKVIGKEQLDKSRETRPSLRKPNNELKALYGHQRILNSTVRGPLRVRKDVTTQLAPDSANVSVEDNKVVVGGKTVPNIWLRDNCHCSSCMHEATKQRLQDTFAIPKDLSIKSASLAKSTDGGEKEIEIVWSDDHASKYTRSFLAQAARTYEKRSIVRQGLTDIQLWDSSIASNPPSRPFFKEQVPRGPLEDIRKYGFCYVDGTPFDSPVSTEALLRRIAFIRETHYGGFYDFTADLASKDTAYTNIALEAHTDNTYFSDPAGLQAFHLLSHTHGSGGASLLVDGFKVADELLQQDREAYQILSTVNVHAHASGNEGISIQPYRGFPVLEHDPSTGDLLRVRWNSSDRASIELPIDEVGVWYEAARKFDALLKKKENEYWAQLTPGRVLIFDNWRVLHGRSAFTGKRRICGGYINRDDWMSRLKMHKYGQTVVMGSLASS
ncbi:Trimethyllysine dioxygenase [Ascochyta rabiei]|uniref:Trimethyllysine dioxygenase n=1 Tax=Didymella rabiei TaxID=5454 RepID=UPI0021FBF004|nr:Trimethyllysine dioxygenase [Ascochyta rabiei]UPX14333.1 Trimethyllysine dioxygenase [Ascochyta rabiei]